MVEIITQYNTVEPSRRGDTSSEKYSLSAVYSASRHRNTVQSYALQVCSAGGLTSMLAEAGDSSVGEWRIWSQSKLSKWSSERPLIALAAQSGWALSSRMTSTGVFWRMRESNEAPRKKTCIWKRSRLRSRFAGFLHKSCINKEKLKQVNKTIQRDHGV